MEWAFPFCNPTRVHFRLATKSHVTLAFAKLVRSKAIYGTNDADLIACMQAEVVSTRVQKLPQLRPLADIT